MDDPDRRLLTLLEWQELRLLDKGRWTYNSQGGLDCWAVFHAPLDDSLWLVRWDDLNEHSPASSEKLLGIQVQREPRPCWCDTKGKALEISQ